MANTDEEEIRETIRRAELEHTLKADCLGTINERITRYLELGFIKVMPNENWSTISAECILLYRDGYFFACISLCQAVAEAIARDLCKKNSLRTSNNFKVNVNRLYNDRKVCDECKKALEEVWDDRNDYHHLNPEVETARVKLQAIAKSKITTLHNVEAEVFAFEWVGGAIKPKYPKYWPQIDKGLLNGFLRFEP